MWRGPSLCCLLAVAHLYFLVLVHSQETDSSYEPQNVTFLTHDLQNVICSWTPRRLGLSYRFCYYDRQISSTKCVTTQENSAQMPLFSFGSTAVELKTFDSSEKLISEKTFQKHDKDIPYVPFTPHIDTLNANFSTHTLNLEWDDDGSAVPIDMDVAWEIQVLRKVPMEVVAREYYNSKLIAKQITILHWSWTSDIPLGCTTHYVQIRCFHHLEEYPGPTSWSEWSLLANSPGKDTGSYYEIFTMTEVAQVGSSLTFCCVWKTGQELVTIQYDSYPVNRIRLSNYGVMIQVPNVHKSITAGDNAWCLTKRYDIVGVTVFVGYPPDVPQDLTCKKSGFKKITCKWKAGRPTNLHSPLRRTNYTLFERTSGKSVTYTGKEYVKYYRCNFPVLDHQRTYHFTVRGINPLGQSEASISIDIKFRGNQRKRNKNKPYF